jgi:hypothetical protein
MAEQAITRGSIRSIFEPNGCIVEYPVMQCVQLKTMDPRPGDYSTQQRFRIVLSDIDNFIQTMLATCTSFRIIALRAYANFMERPTMWSLLGSSRKAQLCG